MSLSLMQQTTQTFRRDRLSVFVHANIQEMAYAAARAAAECLSQAIEQRGRAAAILATGNSQIVFLEALVQGQGRDWNINWSAVTLFHMDEYLGLPETHPASFRRYMRERVESQLNPGGFHYIEGDSLEPIRECERYAALLEQQPLDLCCLGIGENGHLAFNDPPVADFSDPKLVKIVRLDENCRRQQVGEGHFPEMSAVPQYALTLTIPALLRASRVLAIAPEARKANAVRQALCEPVSPACPASHLRTQEHCGLYLDAESVGKLTADERQDL